MVHLKIFRDSCLVLVFEMEDIIMSDNKNKTKDNKPKTSKPIQEEPILRPRDVNGSIRSIFELNTNKEKK